MTKTYLLDTNVLLRVLVGDVISQDKQAREWFLQAKQEEISLIIPEIVVFEIHFGLEKFYSFSKDEILERLKVVLSTPYLHVESQEIFLLALTFYSREKVSFVDCFLLAKSKLTNAEILTFDKKLQKLANQ